MARGFAEIFSHFNAQDGVTRLAGRLVTKFMLAHISVTKSTKFETKLLIACINHFPIACEAGIIAFFFEVMDRYD